MDCIWKQGKFSWMKKVGWIHLSTNLENDDEFIIKEYSLDMKLIGDLFLGTRHFE